MRNAVVVQNSTFWPGMAASDNDPEGLVCEIRYPEQVLIHMPGVGPIVTPTRAALEGAASLTLAADGPPSFIRRASLPAAARTPEDDAGPQYDAQCEGGHTPVESGS
jgi:hypothetical protein